MDGVIFVTAKNHISKTCQSRSRCNNCHGRDHTSICHTKEVPKQQMKTTESQNTDNVRKTLTQRMHFYSKATVYHPDIPHRKQTARVMLDGGSQRSYIVSY